jgi:hypothetical protein
MLRSTVKSLIPITRRQRSAMVRKHGVVAIVRQLTYPAQVDEGLTPRAVSKMVIILGSCHLTLMAVIGIWLWSSPARFEASQPAFTSPYPLGCTSMSLVGLDIRLSSPTLQAWSLIIYSFFLVPGFNLVLPGVVFLALYIYLHRRRLSQPTEQRHAKALLVVPGLLLLLFVNFIFMTDTEVTIHRGAKHQQPGESQWTFGQTLALLLLSLPLRDTALLEFYRRDYPRRITLETFLRGIKLGDVDIVSRLVHRQEVNVNVAAKTGGNPSMAPRQKLRITIYRLVCVCTSVGCLCRRHNTCSAAFGPGGVGEYQR